VPAIASGLTSDGTIIGVKPHADAFAIARFNRANSSWAPWPVRK